ncbi:hypothetical protein [Marinifilum sp.]|uniref:hypothetical protein n=1 Tax=Marinifilum sp. TaxID=2033137 RepID=UPI003BAC6324
MKKAVLLLIIAFPILMATSCKNDKKTSNKQETKNEITNYLTVDEAIASAEKYTNKTIHIKGMVEHVCKHGGKRFKIVNPEGKNEIKIELGDQFKSVEPSIIGNNVKISGKLIPKLLNAEQVKQWEQKMRNSHKGEENTQHFKDELKQIQEIHAKIIAGEISYHTTYSVDCEAYEIE